MLGSGPIRQTLIADASASQWTQVLRGLDLTEEQVDAITGSPSRGPLFTALERGETLGHPMDEVLAVLLKTQSLRLGDETAADLASALHRLVDAWLHTQVEDPTTIPVRTDHGHLPPATRETLRQVDDLIAARVRAVIGTAVGTEPSSLTDVGPMPDDEASASAWEEQVAAVAGHLDHRAGASARPTSAPPSPTASTSTPNWSRSL